MFHNQFTYGYNDISIQPTRLSTIKHRHECNVLKNGKLPIFAAPMSTVINEQNFHIFEDNGINTIMPRNIKKEIRDSYLNDGKWVAYSLSEFAEIIESVDKFNSPVHILIDVANGNMEDIFDLSIKAKEKYGKDNIILMAGNIANPKSYYEYCKAGIDYVRCAVGSGSCCITATQTAIHYGIVSLLDEINVIKNEIVNGLDEEQYNLNNIHLLNYYKNTYKCVTKVIADGGIRNYSDVIKALALGADYVMIGGEFAKLIESCAPTFYYDKDNNIHQLRPLDGDSIREQEGYFDVNESYILADVNKVFYGMASKRGQEDLFGEKKKTSEGNQKTFKCTTNIDKWVQNMKDYLASAMSYCGIEDINDFNQSNVETFLMSPMLQNSINK